MPEPEPRRLTSVERRWVAVVLALAAELVSLLLPRARADTYEGFFQTYYGTGVPFDAERIDVDGFFFGGAAAIEVALMIIVAMLATAMLLRRDLAPGLRTPGLIFATLLPAWAALAALRPGIDGPPFQVLAGGWVGLGAAVVAGIVLAALATAKR